MYSILRNKYQYTVVLTVCELLQFFDLDMVHLKTNFYGPTQRGSTYFPHTAYDY